MSLTGCCFLEHFSWSSCRWYLNLPCNLKMKFLKAIRGKLLKSGVISPGKNTQHAEINSKLISYQLSQKRIIPLIPDWLIREIRQILFWQITSQLKFLFTLMGFDLYQLVPKHESEKKVDFARRVLLFVWAFPIGTVYTYCQMKGTLNQKVTVGVGGEDSLNKITCKMFFTALC